MKLQSLTGLAIVAPPRSLVVVAFCKFTDSVSERQAVVGNAIRHEDHLLPGIIGTIRSHLEELHGCSPG